MGVSVVVVPSGLVFVREVVGDEALEGTVRNAWSLIKAFGDGELWEELERRVRTVLEHQEGDQSLEELMAETGKSVEALLTDPAAWDTAEVCNLKKNPNEAKQYIIKTN